jgi:hypothetical protein
MALSKIEATSITDGAVSAAKLHTTAVTDKLGYTPVNIAGGTMAGALELTTLRVGGAQSRIRTWHWAVSLNQNTRYNLMYNSSAYTDVQFILTFEGFHSGRSYGMYSGLFGGYGSNWTTLGASTSVTPSLVDLDAGRRYFGIDTGGLTGGSGFFYMHMTIFGDSPIALVNGEFL